MYAHRCVCACTHRDKERERELSTLSLCNNYLWFAFALFHVCVLGCYILLNSQCYIKYKLPVSPS